MKTIRKSSRLLSIIGRPLPGILMVEIVEDGRVDLYYVGPCVPFSGTGKSWQWDGMGGKKDSHYETHIADDGSMSCECLGASRVGCKPCRHQAAVKMLCERGKL